jgi:hypothetical protein
VILRDWLHERSDAPPVVLAARVRAVLGERVEVKAASAPAACVDAAEELLRELLSRPSAGRESALDLLTVDALVTYAFEAAANEPDSLIALAESAMSRLASTARD